MTKEKTEANTKAPIVPNSKYKSPKTVLNNAQSTPVKKTNKRMFRLILAN